MHALSFDDDLDNDFEVLIISTTVSTKKYFRYGLSVDADVGLWLEKRQLDGEPDLVRHSGKWFICCHR